MRRNVPRKSEAVKSPGSNRFTLLALALALALSPIPRLRRISGCRRQNSKWNFWMSRRRHGPLNKNRQKRTQPRCRKRGDRRCPTARCVARCVPDNTLACVRMVRQLTVVLKGGDTVPADGCSHFFCQKKKKKLHESFIFYHILRCRHIQLVVAHHHNLCHFPSPCVSSSCQLCARLCPRPRLLTFTCRLLATIQILEHRTHHLPRRSAGSRPSLRQRARPEAVEVMLQYTCRQASGFFHGPWF